MSPERAVASATGQEKATARPTEALFDEVERLPGAMSSAELQRGIP